MIRASATLILISLFIGCGGTPVANGTVHSNEPSAEPGEGDYWLEKFGPYMTEEFKKVYLDTPHHRVAGYEPIDSGS